MADRTPRRCEICGEHREMATKEECFACYRKRMRARDEELVLIDRHNPAIKREHRRMLNAYSKLMVALSELGVNRQHVFAIRDIVGPYIEPITEFLPASEGEREREQARVHVH